MKHTVGPWAAEFVVPPHSADGYWQVQAPEADSIVVADIAECPEIDANARLIAVAPDLLAALRECITEPGAMAERSHAYALRRLAAINTLAKVAIAAAEGAET